MAIDRTALIQILRQELAGQPDRAGRGKWTAEHCVRVAKLAVALRQAVLRQDCSTTSSTTALQRLPRMVKRGRPARRSFWQGSCRRNF